MAKAKRLPAKKDVARALLLKGAIFLHLDPRLPGVSVPSWLNKQPQLVLQVGLDMPVPITDLRVDEAGVSGTLSFNRTPFLCVVPWSAVFAVVGDDGRGMVWPTSMPEEIAAEVAREAQRGAHARAGRAGDAGDNAESARGSIDDPTNSGSPPATKRPRAKAGQRAPVSRVSKPAQSRLRTPAADARASEAESGEEAARSSRPALGVIHGQARSSSAPALQRGDGKRELPPYLRVVK